MKIKSISRWSFLLAEKKNFSWVMIDFSQVSTPTIPLEQLVSVGQNVDELMPEFIELLSGLTYPYKTANSTLSTVTYRLLVDDYRYTIVISD